MTSLLDLPSEVIGLIASFMTIEDVSRASQTCQLFKSWFWFWLKKLEISHKSIPETAFHELIRKCPSLETLELTQIPLLKTPHLHALEKSLIHTLSLNFCHYLDNEGLKAISRISTLRTLNIQYNFRITHDGIRYLCHVPLKAISLRGCSTLTNPTTELLAHINALEYLDLRGCIDLTDFDSLRDLEMLKELNLSKCRLVDYKMTFLRELKYLKSLDLTENDIGYETLEYVAPLTGLKTLKVSRNLKLEEDQAFEVIGSMNALKYLYVKSCGDIKGESVQHLLNLKALECLHLSHVQPSGDIDWSLFEHLKELNLEISNLENSHMVSIGHLNLLEHLNLSGCFQISNRGIMHLANLTCLKSLDLSVMNLISHKGLAHLTGLISLERLNLSFCTNITDDVGPILMKFPRLTDLNLGSCHNITNTLLPTLMAIKTLKHLCLVYVKLDTGILKERTDWCVFY